MNKLITLLLLLSSALFSISCTQDIQVYSNVNRTKVYLDKEASGVVQRNEPLELSVTAYGLYACLSDPWELIGRAEGEEQIKTVEAQCGILTVLTLGFYYDVVPENVVFDFSSLPPLPPSGETEVRVEFKFFNDPDVLSRVMEIFERGSRNSNYTITNKHQKNRKGCVYDIRSPKGAINLERTIRNVLENERARVHLKGNGYITVTP